MKAEVDKLGINKLTSVPTSLNNLKTKVDDLDIGGLKTAPDLNIGKLKTAPVDLKKLSDVVDNEVAKNTKLNTLKTQVNNIEKSKFLM